MPYVVRDTDDKIIGLYIKKTNEASEYKQTDDQEIIDFLFESGNDVITKQLLANYDYSVLRVLEDLIIILIRHHIINFNDFPENAKNKLMNRESLRHLLEQVKHVEGVKAQQEEKDDT